MSEIPQNHQASEPIRDEEGTPSTQASPRRNLLGVNEVSAIISSPHTPSPDTYRSKASSFSILSFGSPRRSALSPNTFNQNSVSYHQASSGASRPTTQLSPDTFENPIRGVSPASILSESGEPSIDQKENQKVSPELKKQLESFITPAPRAASQTSGSPSLSKGSKFGGWAIGKSSIALRPTEPVASVLTTQLWDPPEDAPQGSPEDSGDDRVPTPLSMSRYQSEYVSFPPFESYPKTPRPGLRSRCSDKSWHLLQKLKGKIVEMHNAGLQSSRSSSRNSISSRKSRSPAGPHGDGQQSHTRRGSEGGGGSRNTLESGPSSRSRLKAATVSGGTLRSSAPNLKTVSTAGLSSTANDPKVGPQTHKATIVAVTPETSPQRPQKSPESPRGTSGLPGLSRPLEFASSLFQSLVTIAAGDSPRSNPISPGRGSPSETNIPKSQSKSSAQTKSQSKGKGKAPEGINEDSSEDEMSFMEYIKRFSDSSPTGPSKRPPPPLSTTSWDVSTEEANPEPSTIVKQAIPRNVTFKDQTNEDIGRVMIPMSPILEVETISNFPPEIAPNLDPAKTPIIYTREDYDTMNTYFYNVQKKLLRKKWPFLRDNEIKYLIDNKWLDMEWEDLEDWAQESAQHVDDEDYVERDLFEDLALVDPRGPDAPKQRSDVN
ncbi:hypothetical protein TWF730_005863 [Orbilia blumenaviensis]|uniref:Uncharacterized protein n=1 Tax=Orbilia blumenaviensis TaxID=1796055 RepID=A0AAV9VLU7_9PEZI